MTPGQIEELVDAIKDQWSGVLRPEDAMTIAQKVRAALTVGGYTGLVIASFSELSNAGVPIGLGLSGYDNIGNNEPFLTEPLLIPRDSVPQASGPVPISEAEELLEDALGILTYKAEAYLTGQGQSSKKAQEILGGKLKSLADVLSLKTPTKEPRVDRPATLRDRLYDRYRERGPSATTALHQGRDGPSIYKTWFEQARAGGADSVVDQSFVDLRTAVFLRKRARHLARAMRQHDNDIARYDDPSDTTIKRLIGAEGKDPRAVYPKLLDLVRIAVETGFNPSLVLGEYLWPKALFEAAIVVGAAERSVSLTLEPLAVAGLVQLLRVDETGLEAAPDEVTEAQAFLAARVSTDLRRVVDTWKSDAGASLPLFRPLLGVIPDECFAQT